MSSLSRPFASLACLSALTMLGQPVVAQGGPADIAEYSVVFDATWSAASHPTNYPSSAHWSPLIGASHSDGVVFWEEGGLASPGIEQMAETGAKTLLRTEVVVQIGAGNAGDLIEGFVSIDGVDQTSTTLVASQEFPLVTLVSMIAPSPDWFVGTSGLPLFVDGHWLSEVSYDLYPYDSGTDSGVSFQSPNSDTQPQEPIAEILGFPFASPGEQAPPLGRFIFTRINVPPCSADLDGSGSVGVGDLVELILNWGECAGCAADLDVDGVVGVGDLVELITLWGSCP